MSGDRECIRAIRAELIRLDALDAGRGTGLDVYAWEGEVRAIFTREAGDTERAILCRPDLSLAALRALPGGAGSNAAWDAL